MLQLHWHKDGTKSNNIDEFLDNLICYIYQLGLIVFSVSNIRHVIDEFLDNLIC
jgi:agmatine/peptidylarginine deiminase